MKWKRLATLLVAAMLMSSISVSAELLLPEDGQEFVIEEEIDTPETQQDEIADDESSTLIVDEETETSVSPEPATEAVVTPDSEAVQPAAESMIVADPEDLETEMEVDVPKAESKQSKKAITYYVAFKWNGTAAGKMAKVKMTYGVAQKLPVNQYYKTNYRFVGWNTKADGTGKAYTDAQWVKNLTSKSGTTVNLYAQWEKTKYKNYKIVFTKNAADATGSNLTQTAVNGASVKLWQNHFTRPYYTFAGWAKTATGAVAFTNGQTVTYPNINKDAKTSITLYAKWKQKTYKIVYDKNAEDATGTVSAQTGKQGVAIKLWQNHFSREGYVFKGWALSADGPVVFQNGETVDYAKINKANADQVTLYAVWNGTYTITYSRYNGTGGDVEDQVAEMNEPVRLIDNPYGHYGHTFSGWALSTNGQVAFQDGETVAYSAINAAGSNHVTLYAVWLPNIGSTIKFGDYYGENEWRVLAYENSNVLVISKKGLEAKAYNTDYASVSWKACTLRSWLNGSFYQAAFTESEKARIVTTHLNSSDTTTDTDDKIFLITQGEANTYFVNNMDRQLTASEHALSNGANQSSGRSYWWLRSTDSSAQITITDINGGYREVINVNNKNICVRPSMWLSYGEYEILSLGIS